MGAYNDKGELKDTGAGKGGLNRRVDRGAWDSWWDGYCRAHGHKYVNSRCTRCGRVK